MGIPFERRDGPRCARDAGRALKVVVAEVDAERARNADLGESAEHVFGVVLGVGRVLRPQAGAPGAVVRLHADAQIKQAERVARTRIARVPVLLADARVKRFTSLRV